MDMNSFRQQVIEARLKIDPSFFGKTLSIIDFGNVNYWFEEDKMDLDGNRIKDDEKFAIDFKLLRISGLFRYKEKILFWPRSKQKKISRLYRRCEKCIR
jgi:hypothetical protein